jgi:hypothetical protein
LNWFFEVGGRRVGLEANTVFIGDERYLDRWIFYVGGPCVRLHRFWRGDDDRAVHDHPWDFWTYPLTSYREVVEREVFDGLQRSLGWLKQCQMVNAWRLHKRPAKYRHFVVGRADGSTKPFWTIVFAAHRSNKWGFWPTPETFVYWRFWDSHKGGARNG